MINSFPTLERSDRDREFKKYSTYEIARVLQLFLIEGLSYREIDKLALSLDPSITRGFQSMNIAQYLGLTLEYKGYFLSKNIAEAIDVLKNNNMDELASYLSSLNRADSIDPLESVILGTEGKRTEYYTYKYERNPKLRAEALRIHGYNCAVCDFNFENIYGDLGKGFIEVHHIKPLYSLEKEVEINPQEDLIPLCANCHRMIHSKQNSISTIGELQVIYLKYKL